MTSEQFKALKVGQDIIYLGRTFKVFAIHKRINRIVILDYAPKRKKLFRGLSIDYRYCEIRPEDETRNQTAH